MYCSGKHKMFITCYYIFLRIIDLPRNRNIRYLMMRFCLHLVQGLKYVEIRNNEKTLLHHYYTLLVI